MENLTKIKVSVSKMGAEVRRTKRLLESTEKQVVVMVEELKKMKDNMCVMKEELERVEEVGIIIKDEIKNIEEESRMNKSMKDDSLFEEMEEDDENNDGDGEKVEVNVELI